MSLTTPTLQRQLGRVRRRLFLGVFLHLLAWCWVAGLGLAVGISLAQPYLFPSGGASLRWAVAGGLAGVASVVALVLAVLRAPSAVSAALALDHRFGLRERVTTSLTLREHEAASPAGQVLLADVETRLAPLRVGDRFPIAWPWRPAALVPVVVAALVLLAFFWNPEAGNGKVNAGDPLAATPEAKAEIEKKVQQLANRPRKSDEPRSKDAEQIEADLEKFARKPHNTEDEVRDRIKEASELEERIRKQQKAEAERVDALKEQMKQVERLKRKTNEKKDGPGNQLDKAMAQADFQKAQEEAERLSRKLADQAEAEKLKKQLEDEGDKLQREEKEEIEERLKKKQKNQLNDKDKEQLEEQLEDMKDNLHRLSRSRDEQLKDLENDLKDKVNKGEMSKEQLDRELEEAKNNADKTEQDKQDLKDLAEKLGECQQCMKDGKEGEAAEKMAQAAKKMGKMGKGGEQQEQVQQMARLREVRRVMSRAVGGGPGAGQRPESKEGETGEVERKDRIKMEDGKMEVIGTAPGRGFRGPAKPDELRDEIRQATQEAPAAIDRQRLPASAKKMARDYFEKVREPEKGK